MNRRQGPIIDPKAPPKLRHPPRKGQWLLAALLGLIIISGLTSLYNNENLDVDTIARYLFSGPVLRGVLVTITLTVIGMVVGIALGVIVALMRMSRNPVLAYAASLYVWIFRSIPQLVQIIFWGFFAALYPRIVIGVPFTSVTFVDVRTSSILSAFWASAISLIVIEIAYAAEVIRGGMLAVDPSLRQAARSLGLSNVLTLRKIILPLAMPPIIPPMGNNLVNLLKATSLVSVIGGAELLKAVQDVYAQNFQVIPLLAVAALWYLALTAVLSGGLYALERRFGRSRRQTLRGTRPVAASEPVEEL